MTVPFVMDLPICLAALALWVSILWTIFLIFDVRHRPNPPSLIRSMGLLGHSMPAALLLGTAITTQVVQDTALVWFIALLVFRYWRTLLSVFFWFRYKSAVATPQLKLTPADCTVIIPTVGTAGNIVFDEMVVSILVNRPARLIFSTNADAAEEQVNGALLQILAAMAEGTTRYQIQHGLEPLKVVTQLLVLNAGVSNKRQQAVHAFDNVLTEILALADDTAIWHPQFLQATLPAFQSEKIGFVGTRKWVKRFSHSRNPKASFLSDVWQRYSAGFWNAMGGLYLARHNFETRATNTMDGGVFCVSGRSSLIRSEIVCNAKFKRGFLNEYILRFRDLFPGYGPVIADDDNFLTRWVLNHGWTIKVQSSKEATMTTMLGTYPLKFPQQCMRWSRTTFRQNPIALFIDRTIWWEWPITVWTTYIPWLTNAALLWDTLAIYALTQTVLYTESPQRLVLLCSLIAIIWATKLVKTAAWFWEYPLDFLLYFIIPAYPLFVYYHSMLKVYTAFTFWDLSWSGRKLK